MAAQTLSTQHYRATDWTPDDWEVLAAIVRLDEGVTVDNRTGITSTGRRYQHRDFVVYCNADPAAREALAHRLESGAREQAKALRGTGPYTLKPHSLPKPKFSWDAVKAVLIGDELNPGNSGRREIANALAMLGLWDVTPTTTANNTTKRAGIPPSDILVKPEPVTLTAKNGDTLHAVLGQVRDGQKWVWVVTEPHSGLSVGICYPTKKDTLQSARKAVSGQTDLDRVNAKTADDVKADTATQRLAALRDWAGYKT